MKNIKNYLFCIGYIIFSIFILTLLLSILSFFNVISDSLYVTFKFFIIIISLFIGGFIIAKKTTKKKYLEGIKLGSIFSLLLFLFSFLGFNKFKLMTLFYYLIIILSSMLGAMFSLIKKTKES